MSAAKMAEYLDAGAHRRERILCDQKQPPAFKTSTYTHATNAIRAALVAGGDVAQRLGEFVERLQRAPAGTPRETVTVQCCSAAARRFADLYPALGLAGVAAVRPAAPAFSLVVEGVRITAAPLVLLQRTGRGGAPQVGALLAMFRKERAVGERGGKVAAEIVRRALVEAGYAGVHPELCVAVDVFGGARFQAPRHGKQIADDLASACREIAGRWPTLPTALRRAA